MIIRPNSDIHREFDPFKDKFRKEPLFDLPILEDEKNMVLVLAGDITANHNIWKNRPKNDGYTKWLKELAKRHKAVVYVAGNHESYYGVISEVHKFWHGFADGINNFYFLENEVVIIDGVRFLGTTLWTSLHNPLDDMHMRGMNDHKHIKVSKKVKWSPHNWKISHSLAIDFLEKQLAADFDGKTVVITHHAPSLQSIHESHFGDPLNCCYASYLDRFMWEYPIDVWIHGHTHHSWDYNIGDEQQSCRVICNPRGYYPKELNPDYNPELTIEI